MRGATPFIMPYNAYNLSVFANAVRVVFTITSDLLSYYSSSPCRRPKAKLGVSSRPIFVLGLNLSPPTACPVAPTIVSQPEFQRVGEYWTSLKYFSDVLTNSTRRGLGGANCEC